MITHPRNVSLQSTRHEQPGNSTDPWIMCARDRVQFKPECQNKNEARNKKIGPDASTAQLKVYCASISSRALADTVELHTGMKPLALWIPFSAWPCFMYNNCGTLGDFGVFSAVLFSIFLQGIFYIPFYTRCLIGFQGQRSWVKVPGVKCF